MAIPKRHDGSPGTYFVTSRTWQGRRLFQLAEACGIFVENLLRHRDQGKYALHSFVLMPDHFHALVTPGGDVALERAMQYVKGGSSRLLGESLRVRPPVWQRGFTDHRIRDVSDRDRHVLYVEQNPVKAGLANSSEQYAWSSASGNWAMDKFPQRLKPLVSGVTVRHD